jgi:HlyD family secretion protein
MGVVRDIRVKKGDSVTKDQVVAVLDDVEYLAQLKQATGALEVAQVQVKQAQLDVDRARRLVAEQVEMKATLEDAELRLAAGQADVKRLEGQVELVQTYLDWTIIRSPINGVVLEKLVDPNELVTPQSFGGTRGPSTALISLGDPEDLQVEIELNESDLSKIYLNQACRISPEAYLDRVYQGYVVEIAPEANRQKGTLQIKVQIENPDKYLTPELSAKVDFMPGNTE